MRPVSDAFLRTMRGSRVDVFRATVCETFQTGTTPTGTRIDILGGDVTLDGTADVRSTLQLDTDGTRAWPATADALFAPYGNEIYVERGVQYSDALVEYVGLGYFRVETAEQGDAPDGVISISGSDRMAGVVEADLLTPMQFGSGATLGTIFDDLILSLYPDATIEWDDDTDDVAIARSLICERSRYQFLDDLVRANAKIWYWDHRGVLVIASAPDEDEPVWDIEYGPGRMSLGGVLTGMGRSLTRDGVFNAVVATGQGADSEISAYGVAVDDNPDSPTYYGGRFGQVPKFYTSSAIASDAQAQDAAAEVLRQSSGLPYSVDLELSPNPALEPWDPVWVRAAGYEATERHVLASLTIPLTTASAMTAATRQKTVVLIGSA